MRNPEGNSVKYQFQAPECSESFCLWFITAFQESSCAPRDHFLIHLYRDQMETHGGAPYQHFFPTAFFGIGNSGFGRTTLVINFQRIHVSIVMFSHIWKNNSGRCGLSGNWPDTLQQVIKKKNKFCNCQVFFTAGVCGAWWRATCLWRGCESRDFCGALSLFMPVLKWKVKVGCRQKTE